MLGSPLLLTACNSRGAAEDTAYGTQLGIARVLLAPVTCFERCARCEPVQLRDTDDFFETNLKAGGIMDVVERWVPAAAAGCLLLQWASVGGLGGGCCPLRLGCWVGYSAL